MTQHLCSSATNAGRPSPVSHHRILVVDDDSAVRALFAEALGRAGFDVTTAANGAEAIDEIESTEFQAVTCDLQMPVLGGAACYAKVLAMRPDIAASFVFVATQPDRAQQRFLEDTGCPVLWKPVSLSRLIGTVQAVVARPALAVD